MSLASTVEEHLKPNWRHVGIFLAMTFGLAWFLDLGIYLHGGLGKPGTVAALQLQMLLPAFSATMLGIVFFRESPIHRSRAVGRGLWLFGFMLALTVLYAVSVAVIWAVPQKRVIIAVTIVTQVVTFLGLVLLVVLRITGGRGEMARVGLAWGRGRFYIALGLGVIAFYVLQAALNGLLGLGPTHLASVPAIPGFGAPATMLIAGLQSVVLAPFFAVLLAFGEEYGWRGYLQSELIKLGRVRGVIIVGVIWGVWHWPIILMGYNYPGHPFAGLLLMLLYTMGLAVVLGFAVLRTGSVVLAAYLHALNDQVIAFILFLGFKPHNPVFAFGIGIYGVATLAIVALLFVRLSSVWKEHGVAGRAGKKA